MPETPLVSLDTAASNMNEDVLEIRKEGKVLIDNEFKVFADRCIEQATQFQLSNVIHISLGEKTAGRNRKATPFPPNEILSFEKSI